MWPKIKQRQHDRSIKDPIKAIMLFAKLLTATIMFIIY